MKLPLALLALLFAGASLAAPIVVEAPYSHPTPAPGVPGVGFFTLRNNGTVADRLLSATSPAAGRVEIHRSGVVNGVMQMRAVSDGVALPAGASVPFAPGGLHLMLFNLAAPLKDGQSLPVTLQFERAGAVSAVLAVQPRAAAAKPADDHSHHGHEH